MNFWLTSESLEERNLLVEEFKSKRTTTGINAIDLVFTNLYQGSVYGVCAATGVGKTTFLLATAKKMAEQGKRVLYLSIEMSIMQILNYCENTIIPTLCVCEFDNQWDEVEEFVKANSIDIICYDYIGARLNNWDDLIKEADNLATFAKDNNIIVFTALQASQEINKVDTSDETLYTPMYVSFSKGMINKFAGCAYILKNSLYCMKNRYENIIHNPVPLQELDYEKKEWKNGGFNGNTQTTSKMGPRVHSTN